jgi:hypothetical protein
MRRYDEPIEVRRGLVAGQEAPEQFIWRDRLWVVRDVVSHWVETGAWWDQEGIAALLGVGAEQSGAESNAGSGRASAGVTAVPLGADLLAESDLWRIEASRGRVARLLARPRLNKPPESEDIKDEQLGSRQARPPMDDLGYGVFDLAFDWGQARWRLVGCVD